MTMCLIISFLVNPSSNLHLYFVSVNFLQELGRQQMKFTNQWYFVCSTSLYITNKSPKLRILST